MGQVGDVEKQGSEPGVDLFQAVFQGGDLLPHFPHGQDDRGGVLAVAFHPGDLFRGFVSLEAQGFRFLKGFLPFRGEIGQGHEVNLLPPGFEPLPDDFQVLQDEFRV